MGKARRPLRVLMTRPPVRRGHLYFRVQQYAEYLHQRGDTVGYFVPLRRWPRLLRAALMPAQWISAWNTFRLWDVVFFFPNPFMLPFVALAKGLGRRIVIDHFTSYVRHAEVLPSLLYVFARQLGAPEKSIAEAYRPNPGTGLWAAGGWLFDRLDRATYCLADHVIAHTESMQRALVDFYGLPHQRVVTIYSVVDIEQFTSRGSERVNELRHRFGLADKFVVFYHGKRHPWHGYDYLEQAFDRLVAQGRPVFLFTLGHLAPAPGTHRAYLDDVPYDELPAYLELADVWCSGFDTTERGERSLSSTMIQAMAMARPVITSPGGEKDSFLQDNINALLVPPRDPAAIAARITWCMDHRDEARRIGQAAGRLVETRFSIEQLRRTLDQILVNQERTRVL